MPYQNNTSQERRIQISTIVDGDQTHYKSVMQDVKIDHDNNDAETVLWTQQPPVVYWGLSKAQVIAGFEALKISDSEYISVYDSAIVQLDNL